MSDRQEPASFGPVAPYYDALMSNVPYDMWAGYYDLLMATAETHAETLLDVCCGTGNMAEEMVHRGYAVTGFDISAPMIEAARSKAHDSGLAVEYHVADATDFDLGKTFDGAFSFFDSLNYITTPEGLRSALIQVGRHLGPGGSFCFDLNTAYAFEARMFDQENLKPRSKLKYKWVGEYDPSTRLIRVVMDFWYGDAHFTELHTQRAHPLDEVREWLADAGFDEILTFDAYTLDPPRKRSDRVHFIALKRR